MKRLEIEWRHLDIDGSTCTRCASTGDSIKEAIKTLDREYSPEGWEIVLEEKLLSESEIGESNLILLNNIPLEKLLPNALHAESCCDSCTDLIGEPTSCRTVELGDQTYESIPTHLIVQAARNLITKHSRGIQ